MVFQNDILAGASGAGGGYEIAQSVRFNDNDSAYLYRTFGTPTDATNWTFSTWIKRCNLGTEQWFFNSGASAAAYYIRFESTDKIRFRASTSWDITTTQVFRDVSAWYHIVATFANGAVTLYVNNESIATASVSDTTYNFFTNIIHSIGGSTIGGSNSDIYLAETHGIDGQALAPTNFGEYNDDGVWIPKRFEGTYGSNGFYLKGQDSAALGDDSSGNNNDFTSSGLTASDQVPDSPTDNYCTLNSLTGVNSGSSVVTQANGNLEATMTANYVGTFGTLAANSGKYYFEYSYAADANYADGRLCGGVVCVETADHGHFRIDGGSFYYPDKTTEGNYMVFHRSGNGQQSNTGTSTSAYNTNLSSSSATGGPESGPDIYMVAMDLDNDNLYWGKNGTWYGASSTSGSDYTDATPIAILSAHQGKYFAPAFYWTGAASGTTTVLNCGQDATFGGRYSSPAGDFYYTPPTGFSKLSTANLPTPAIADGSAYFQTTLYTGTGSTNLEVNQSENSTFQPDLVWVKQRNKVDNHVLTDAVRGAPKALYSNSTAAEVVGTGGITSLDPDGFTLSGDGSVWNNVNQSGITAAAWQWLAANGTASNTDGSITSTVSANTTAGFSIVSYTGNGSAGATVGHGLGIKPSMLICKNRDNTEQWIVYEEGQSATKYGLLNSSSAFSSSSGAWNNTEPTSSVVTLGGGGFGTNVSSNAMIMYAFAEVDGFSKFGSYTGNGSAAGPFVWCGFRPALIIGKSATAAENWWMYDTTRNTYNVADDYLSPNLTSTESTAAWFDINSNGFKVRDNGNAPNGSGATIIFMAFAEHPFGGDGVAPVPAR